MEIIEKQYVTIQDQKLHDNKHTFKYTMVSVIRFDRGLKMFYYRHYNISVSQIILKFLT